MNKLTKLDKIDSISINQLNHISIDDVVKLLLSYKFHLKTEYDNIIIVINDDDYHTCYECGGTDELIIMGERLETDEEYDRRLKNEELALLKQQKKDTKKLEALQKEQIRIEKELAELNKKQIKQIRTTGF